MHNRVDTCHPMCQSAAIRPDVSFCCTFCSTRVLLAAATRSMELKSVASAEPRHEFFGCIPTSTDGRVIIPVEPHGFCSSGSQNVLAEEIIMQMPRVISEKGVTQSEWEHHLRRFRSEVQRTALSVMAIIMLFISIFGIPYLVSRDNKLQRVVAAWTEQFNRAALEARGLYCKTQKSVEIRDEDTTIEHAWIAIATTPEEVVSLKAEAHVFMYNIFSNTSHAVEGRWKCCFTCNGVQEVI
jgi:hypothetical protein